MLLVAHLFGCTATPDLTNQGLEADGVFLLAKLVEAGPLPPPPGLTAPIPADPDEMFLPGAPTWNSVWLEVRFGEGLATILPWAIEHPQAFDKVMNHSRFTCAALRPHVTTGADVLLEHLASCGEPSDEALMRTAPASTKASWGARMHSDGHTIPAFVWEAVPELSEKLGTHHVLIELLDTLETDRPELADLLVHAARAKPDHPEALGIALRHQRDPRLERVQQFARFATAPPDVMNDPDAVVRSGEVWLPGLLHRFPRQRSTLLAAVERCASDPGEVYATHCLHTLATADWTRAQRVSTMRPVPFGPQMEVLAATLARFGSPEEVLAHVEGLGFPHTKTAELPHIAPVTVADVLENQGAARGFDNTSAEVVAGYLARQHPDLADVFFEQVHAPLNADEFALGFLRAWRGTTRWHVVVPLDIYEEQRAVVGLLNGVLKKRESDQRVVQLLDKNLWALGPRASLETLQEDGLIAISVP